MPLPRVLQLVNGILSMLVPVSSTTGTTQANSLVATNTNGVLDPSFLPTVAITGGTETGVASTGGTLDNCPIGATTPAAGTFTTLAANTQILGPNTGNNQVPGFGFAGGAGSSGLYWTGNAVALVNGGVNVFQAGNNYTAQFNFLAGFSFAVVSASQSLVSFTGALYTGGTGATTWPSMYWNQGATAPTNFSTAGTYLGINAASGFTGNCLHFALNGALKFQVTSAGNLTCGTISSGAITSTGALASAGQVGAVQVLTTATTLTAASQEVAINAAVTTTLAASPTVGQKIRLVNLTSAAVTIAGNGHNITFGAAAASSISLAAYAQANLTYFSSTAGWA